MRGPKVIMYPIYRFAAPLVIGGAAYLMYPSPAVQPPAGIAASPSGTAAPYAGPSFALPTADAYPPLPPAAPVRPPVFALDGNGELVLDASTAIRLDLLLADLPAQPTMPEMQQIEERAKEGLPQEAARKALRVLDDYLAYRRAESELEAQARSGAPLAAQAMLDKLAALRREHFGAQVAHALFAAAEAQARFGIQATYIEADPALSRQEKTQRIAALRQALPPHVALPDDAHDELVHDVEDRVAALRRQGVPETDIWQLREQGLGPESAQAITEMEAQQLEWEQRYRTYLLQKNAILSSAESAAQKQERIDALLRQHYSEQEIAIARAYDASSMRQ